MFVLAEVIDPPGDGVQRVDDVRGWMSDSLVLVSSLQRVLLAEFLLFPGVLQSVANPCNDKDRSAVSSHQTAALRNTCTAAL